MINIETYKKIYVLQKRIRYIEETIAKKYSEKEMRCPTHLSLGQEAIAAATGIALKKNDVSRNICFGCNKTDFRTPIRKRCEFAQAVIAHIAFRVSCLRIESTRSGSVG